MNCALITICNDAFIEPCKTMIYSFIKNNSWFTGDIIICCDSTNFTLSCLNRGILKNIYSKIIIREVNTEDYTEFINNFSKVQRNHKYLPSAYTYEVFDLAGYDKVLYLDADMLIIESIEDLFKYTCDIGVVPLSKDYFSLEDINKIGYYNLGLVFVNYTNINPRHIKYDLIKIGETTNPFRCSLFELGVFNANLPNNTEDLPIKYNYFDKYQLENKSIIHFVHNKPWLKPDANDNTKLWKLYNDELNKNNNYEKL